MRLHDYHYLKQCQKPCYHLASQLRDMALTIWEQCLYEIQYKYSQL
jgi:hypothetical protein